MYLEMWQGNYWTPTIITIFGKQPEKNDKLPLKNQQSCHWQQMHEKRIKITSGKFSKVVLLERNQCITSNINTYKTYTIWQSLHQLDYTDTGWIVLSTVGITGLRGYVCVHGQLHVCLRNCIRRCAYTSAQIHPHWITTYLPLVHNLAHETKLTHTKELKSNYGLSWVSLTLSTSTQVQKWVRSVVWPGIKRKDMNYIGPQSLHSRVRWKGVNSEWGKSERSM